MAVRFPVAGPWAAATALVLALLPRLALAGTRPISETDLFRFTWIADPQIAPDGRRVAFVRVTVNEKKDGYDSAIWMVETDGARAPRALTAGPQDLSPRWSPDGRRLAFTRAVEKAGKLQPPQLYLMTMDGGEARAAHRDREGRRLSRLGARRAPPRVHEHGQRERPGACRAAQPRRRGAAKSARATSG